MEQVGELDHLPRAFARIRLKKCYIAGECPHIGKTGWCTAYRRTVEGLILPVICFDDADTDALGLTCVAEEWEEIAEDDPDYYAPMVRRHLKAWKVKE